MMLGENTANVAGNAAPRQIVTFLIDDKVFGIEVEKVREIKGWQAVTPLPHSPEAVLGVINLRGMILPVYDLRAVIGLQRATPGRSHVIIVVNLGAKTGGILVDSVSDIIDVDNEQIKEAPDLGNALSYVRGIVIQNETMVTILDVTPVMEEHAQNRIH